jgi:DNA repair exonuclease SbcCD ATPase subunit
MTLGPPPDCCGTLRSPGEPDFPGPATSSPAPSRGGGAKNEAITVTATLDPQNPGATLRTPEVDGGAANLEKVRDLLFGGQMRDYDRRFASLEERLVRETGDLREDVKKRLAAIEQLLTREIDALSERLKSEQEDRSSAVTDLSRQLDDTARTFEKKTSQLDDQMSRGLREVRQQLHDQHQQLSDDLKRQADQILERLARASHQLQSDKTDRASLAALLTEMAMRLTDDFRLPTAEDAGRG